MYKTIATCMYLKSLMVIIQLDCYMAKTRKTIKATYPAVTRIPTSVVFTFQIFAFVALLSASSKFPYAQLSFTCKTVSVKQC